MASKITSALVPAKTSVPSQSCAAAANKVSGYVDTKDAPALLLSAQLGALGGGTVTMTLLQASDSSGTGAKAVAGYAGKSSAVDNTLLSDDVEITPTLLDADNGFRFVALKLANVGGTGAQVAGMIQQPDPRYAT